MISPAVWLWRALEDKRNPCKETGSTSSKQAQGLKPSDSIAPVVGDSAGGMVLATLQRHPENPLAETLSSASLSNCQVQCPSC